MTKLRVIVASDSVGETGELVAKACLSQFHIDESGEVLITYSYIGSEEHVDDVVYLAKSKNTIGVFTIITPVLHTYIWQELKSEEMPSVDITGPLVRVLEGKTEEQ